MILMPSPCSNSLRIPNARLLKIPNASLLKIPNASLLKIPNASLLKIQKARLLTIPNTLLAAAALFIVVAGVRRRIEANSHPKVVSGNGKLGSELELEGEGEGEGEVKAEGEEAGPLLGLRGVRRFGLRVYASAWSKFKALSFKHDSNYDSKPEPKPDADARPSSPCTQTTVSHAHWHTLSPSFVLWLASKPRTRSRLSDSSSLSTVTTTPVQAITPVQTITPTQTPAPAQDRTVLSQDQDQDQDVDVKPIRVLPLQPQDHNVPALSRQNENVKIDVQVKPIPILNPKASSFVPSTGRDFDWHSGSGTGTGSENLNAAVVSHPISISFAVPLSRRARQIERKAAGIPPGPSWTPLVPGSRRWLATHYGNRT